MSIRIRFVSDGTGDLVSRIIRGAELGFWPSHVEAVMPDGTYLGAHSDDGIQARPSTYDAGKWAQQLFVDAPCDDDAAARFHAFLTSRIGIAYDMIAIGEMAIGVVTGEYPSWPESGQYICSALITAALLTAGIIKGAPATVRLSTPRDVLVGLGYLVPIGAPETAPRVLASLAAPGLYAAA